MAQVGRISGPLLQANLERNGIDLAVRNDLSTTQLLYLDVTNGRIGVNNPTPTHELHVLDTIRTTSLIVDNTNALDNWRFNNGSINLLVGDISISAGQGINAPTIETEQLGIDDNKIYTLSSNTNIDLVPNNTATVEVQSDLTVVGSLHAVGNLTFDGKLTFGDEYDDSTSNVDTVTFEADIDSDIIPNKNDVYNLGSRQKRWDWLETRLVNGRLLDVTSVIGGDVEFGSTQGNIFYVSQNGTDTNNGSHPQSPVAHIKRALELVDGSTGGPVTIFVYPGDYEEETPLVVPSNVTIIGEDMRNTSVFPTSYTLSEDVFHLDGETTIQNLTIKNFYFDDNKGYAFRFKPDGVITSRSPYIQNCSVITQGTTTTVDDPRGFASGDAGKGAYVDGAELNSASLNAAMLFHSCTFITPGVDGLTATNGARIEWLNSFTYFANRGLYAFNNSSGRVGNDGSTVEYGAEIRSIGSASVYGNYGAVADGADTLMYLIQHNFAYIGAGHKSTNDVDDVIQSQEVNELNSGRVYYTSTDHLGDYRVGDSFYVNQQDGSISFNAGSIDALDLTEIRIDDGVDVTVINANFIRLGDFVFSGNELVTANNDLEVSPTSSIINLQDSTNITNNLSINGNFSFDGGLTLLGNDPTDKLILNTDLDQNFNPSIDSAFSLGSNNKKWYQAWLSSMSAGDVYFRDNFVTTTVSSADLELRANAAGIILIPNNNVEIAQDLTVSKLTTLQGTTITGTVTHVGDKTQTGNLDIAGEISNGNISIEDNFISTTVTNSDLELRANGTGEVLIPSNDVTITNDLTVSNDTDLQNTVITGTLTQTGDRIQTGNYLLTNYNITGNLDVSSQAQFEEILFDGNVIQTTTSDSDLELRASGTGKILIDNTVHVIQNLTVDNIVNNNNINVTLQTEFNETDVSDITVKQNYITTNNGNLDLLLRASGTGEILIPNNNVIFEQDLTVNSSTLGSNIVYDVNFNGTLTQTGDRTQTGNIEQYGELTVDSVYIEDNFITSNESNADLELHANGTGKVLVTNNNFEISNNLEVTGTTSIRDLQLTGNINYSGDGSFIGLYTSTNLTISNKLTVDANAQFEEILVANNVITTTSSNSNLELRASGTGEVLISNNNVQVNNNLFTASITTGNINVDNDLVLDELVITDSNIEINENYITTKTSNADLELRATGDVVIQENTLLEQDLTINGNTELLDTIVVGDVELTGNRIQTGDYTLIGNLNISSLITDEAFQFDDIKISGNVLETTLSNSDLELRAAGTGEVVLQENVQMSANLTVDTLNVNSISVDNSVDLEVVELSTDIQFEDNTITTTNSNSNLELRAVGSGSVYLEQIEFTGNTLSTENAVDSTLTNIKLGVNDNLEIDSNVAIIVPKGTIGERNNSSGDLRFNTEDNVFEGFSGSNITFSGVYSASRNASVTAHPFNNTLLFATEGTQHATIDIAGMNLHGLQVGDILFDENTISTNISNSDLELRTDGTGKLILDYLELKGNAITNNTPDENIVLQGSDNTHYVKFAGDLAVKFPSGTTLQRPLNPAIGTTRHNNQLNILETWTGTEWKTSAGDFAAITEEQMDEEAFVQTLIYG